MLVLGSLTVFELRSFSPPLPPLMCKAMSLLLNKEVKLFYVESIITGRPQHTIFKWEDLAWNFFSPKTSLAAESTVIPILCVWGIFSQMNINFQNINKRTLNNPFFTFQLESPLYLRSGHKYDTSFSVSVYFKVWTSNSGLWCLIVSKWCFLFLPLTNWDCFKIQRARLPKGKESHRGILRNSVLNPVFWEYIFKKGSDLP